MSKKAKSNGAVDALLGGTTITLKQKINGKLVDKEFELAPYSDLPRQVRRNLRNAVMKATPDADGATGKADIYLSAYEAGLIALRAAGATIDPNDDTLSVTAADELDQLISVVGIRVIGEMFKGEGDSKNAPEPPQMEESGTAATG